MRTRAHLPVTGGGLMPPSGQFDVGSGNNATNLCGNDLGGAATEISRDGTFTASPRSHTPESASTAVASVTSGAGSGKL